MASQIRTFQHRQHGIPYARTAQIRASRTQIHGTALRLTVKWTYRYGDSTINGSRCELRGRIRHGTRIHTALPRARQHASTKYARGRRVLTRGHVGTRLGIPATHHGTYRHAQHTANTRLARNKFTHTAYGARSFACRGQNCPMTARQISPRARAGSRARGYVAPRSRAYARARSRTRTARAARDRSRAYAYRAMTRDHGKYACGPARDTRGSARAYIRARFARTHTARAYARGFAYATAHTLRAGTANQHTASFRARGHAGRAALRSTAHTRAVSRRGQHDIRHAGLRAIHASRWTQIPRDIPRYAPRVRASRYAYAYQHTRARAGHTRDKFRGLSRAANAYGSVRGTSRARARSHGTREHIGFRARHHARGTRVGANASRSTVTRGQHARAYGHGRTANSRDGYGIKFTTAREYANSPAYRLSRGRADGKFGAISAKCAARDRLGHTRAFARGRLRARAARHEITRGWTARIQHQFASRAQHRRGQHARARGAYARAIQNPARLQIRHGSSRRQISGHGKYDKSRGRAHTARSARSRKRRGAAVACNKSVAARVRRGTQTARYARHAQIRANQHARHRARRARGRLVARVVRHARRERGFRARHEYGLGSIRLGSRSRVGSDKSRRGRIHAYKWSNSYIQNLAASYAIIRIGAK